MADGLQAAKADLWRKLYGSDLSPALLAALHYVDVRERVIKLTSGGWVRDEGTTLYASGADPVVVAVMVEAAKAKGWTSVRLWGSPKFVAEARRQFEAVGISVSVGDPPPPLHVAPTEPPPAQPQHDPAEVVAEFGRWRANAEARLAEIRRPTEPPADLTAILETERKADDAWRDAIPECDATKKTRDEAKQALEQASFLKRRSARRRLEAAQVAFDAARGILRKACGIHDDVKAKADAMQREFDWKERRRRADLAESERRAQAEVAFAAECERIASTSLELSAQGREAVEAAARARLASQADNRLQPDAFATLEEDADVSTAKP